MNHTREPWYAIQNPIWGNADYRISDKEDDGWANFGQIAYASEYNARRIVACVNACEGITNEALEADVVACAIDNLSNSLPDGEEQFYFGDVKVWEDV